MSNVRVPPTQSFARLWLAIEADILMRRTPAPAAPLATKPVRLTLTVGRPNDPR